MFDYFSLGLPILLLPSTKHEIFVTATGTGFVAKDVEDLAALIIDLSKQPHRLAQAAQNIKEKILPHHTWQNRVAQVLTSLSVEKLTATDE